MKAYLVWAAYAVCLMGAVCCDAASSTPVRLDCEMLRGSPVTDLEQRIEIATQGFSVLPPQGEHWCYRFLSSQVVSFFKIPQFEKAFDRPPSVNDIAALRMLSAIAISLKGLIDLPTNIQSAEELKTLVNILIGEHLFPQILAGVRSPQHSFQLLESQVVTDSHLGALCVRFNATLEERGNSQAPDLVFLLNLPSSVVCRHPTAPEVGLIWVGFAERYVQGDEPVAETLKAEYEPYVQSVRFMRPQ